MGKATDLYAGGRQEGGYHLSHEIHTGGAGGGGVCVRMFKLFFV